MSTAKKRVSVTCVSDLHGTYPKLQGGDILIVAGDLTGMDSPAEYYRFSNWLLDQKYEKKVFIAGNHDGRIEKCCPMINDELMFKGYLEDRSTSYEGWNIWGSPWTPEFCNWHFMLPRGAEIKAKWDLIPQDTDILVTHAPPYGILDTPSRNKTKYGCVDLALRVKEVKPRLHVFGHIHGGYGIRTIENDDGTKTTFINAAHMDEDYEPVNRPITLWLGENDD